MVVLGVRLVYWPMNVIIVVLLAFVLISLGQSASVEEEFGKGSWSLVAGGILATFLVLHVNALFATRDYLKGQERDRVWKETQEREDKETMTLVVAFVDRTFVQPIAGNADEVSISRICGDTWAASCVVNGKRTDMMVRNNKVFVDAVSDQGIRINIV